MLLRAVQGLQKKKKTAAAVEEENNASSPSPLSPLSFSLSLTLVLLPPPPFFTKQSWHWSERRKIEEYYKSLNESK